jgi:hypothetical protein
MPRRRKMMQNIETNRLVVETKVVKVVPLIRRGRKRGLITGNGNNKRRYLNRKDFTEKIVNDVVKNQSIITQRLLEKMK